MARLTPYRRKPTIKAPIKYAVFKALREFTDPHGVVWPKGSGFLVDNAEFFPDLTERLRSGDLIMIWVTEHA